MARSERPTKTSPERGVGQYAGLDVPSIIVAARAIEPRNLTMQAVADRLGVDRKALNHHVRDRDTLLELVATAAFTENFAAIGVQVDGRWQDACRAYADAFTESLISIGALSEYFQPGSSLLAGIIDPTEKLLERLLDAGFSEEKAAQTLMLLMVICTGHARHAMVVREIGEHPGLSQLRRALDHTPTQAFRRLLRMADPEIDTSGPGQFEASMDIFVRGAEAVLARPSTLPRTEWRE